MRKVTTINLHNNAYQVDEEGFEALRAYLARAEAALANNPDRAEILSDLEQAIADRCAATLGPYKTVVSTQEIEQILKDMGPVAGAAPEADDAASANAAGAAAGATTGPGASPRPRRLYRLREDQKLTGVCAGLAAYAGIDVTWVRVAFILVTIFSIGFGLVAYIALVFVMPIAETPDQVAAAHGAPFNAQDVVDRVKKKSAEFRDDGRAARERLRHRRRWQAAGTPAQPPGGFARVAGGVMLPILTVISAVWFAAMAIAAFSVWWSYEAQVVAWNTWGHWPQFPRWIVLLLLLVIYAVIALPIGAGRRAALYYANGGRLHGWADAWSGLLWLALVAVILVAAWWVLPQLQELLHHVVSGTRVVLHV